MPRTGGTYAAPAGTKGTSGATIQSAPYNAFIDDLVTDANFARPVTAGGTGATTGGGALTNLGVTTFAQTILDDGNAATARATLDVPGLSVSNTFTGNANSFGKDGANGYVRARAGDTTFPGYIEFFNRLDVRWGYLGLGAGTALRLFTDTGYTFQIVSDTAVTGAFSVADTYQVNFGSLSTSGASTGVRFDAAYTLLSSGTGTAARSIVRMFNANGQVGSIQSTGTATAYNTSSDETLKNFIGEMSAEDAATIIRADPVRRFTWTQSGEEAIGWGAQTSYAVSPDLASPGGWVHPMTGEACEPNQVFWINDATGENAEPESGGAVAMNASYQPWGMDHSRRTPYLWAAVAGLLQKVDELTATVANLETRLEALEWQGSGE